MYESRQKTVDHYACFSWLHYRTIVTGFPQLRRMRRPLIRGKGLHPPTSLLIPGARAFIRPALPTDKEESQWKAAEARSSKKQAAAFLIGRFGACNPAMKCFRNQSLDNLIAFVSIDGGRRGFPPEMYCCVLS